MKFIHRTFHNDNGHLIDTYFSDLLINRENARRQRLRIPDVRLDIERQFTIFQACTLFNEISPNLLDPMSKYLLKKKFYEYALNNY